MVIFENDFQKVNWGPDEAKGDRQLKKYFVKIPEYEGIKNGEYRYIIGRKGTGKTAIIEQIANEASSEYNSFVKYLSLRNFPIQTIRELKDRSLGNKSQFVPIWTFLILTELGKLIIKDNSIISCESVNKLQQFYKINFPSDLGFTETLKNLKSNENKVSIITKWLGYENKIGSSDEVMTSVHYQKASEILMKLIKDTTSDCYFFLLFDELDEGYSANDKNLNLLLLSLFRAVENTFLDLKDNLNIRPVLALRSDIFNNLEDNDLNKLDDYIINLKWTKEFYASYSLYDLINARINASINVKYPEKAWEQITINNDRNIPRKINSLWEFIYNRTFERPRDIIKFMKYCKRQNPKGKLDFKTVKKAEVEFSEWFFREFRDEIQSHLPIWQEASQAFIKLNEGVLTFDEIRNEFENDSKIVNYLQSNNKNHEDILEVLFNFGLIGTLSESKRWFFKYKDDDLPFNHNQKMIVHFGFTRKFRMKVY
ncbi:P-loop ATPase, Sll1717 family [Christiangramia flava]|uniref:Uncharacterized protein n=1 Tax=Christiangramia flava JLT2011 TaxID=1229726 RepID=A0A1L7I100_9FLAO|nr:hypothetical protein [Christiangramia flava]APU67278.1 hypothetical protein GRFL_0554 [Christiangramia flava JLT2011]OSS39866.1 hypothetical protein C723_0983 [Christiangramia flava JLT2011]